MKNSKKRRNAVAVAMRNRHPRRKIMTSRNQRRSKDAGKSWRREIES